MSDVYQRRRDLVTDALREIGLDVTPPRATPYFWARVPSGYTSASFAELVLEQANVVVSPGNAYGPSGEGYVRLSLTVPDERLQEAVSRIHSFGVRGELQMGRPVISDGGTGTARAS
jgi:LL-diaminopimelate aminotransferase